MIAALSAALLQQQQEEQRLLQSSLLRQQQQKARGDDDDKDEDEDYYYCNVGSQRVQMTNQQEKESVECVIPYKAISSSSRNPTTRKDSGGKQSLRKEQFDPPTTAVQSLQPLPPLAQGNHPLFRASVLANQHHHYNNRAGIYADSKPLLVEPSSFDLVPSILPYHQINHEALCMKNAQARSMEAGEGLWQRIRSNRPECSRLDVPLNSSSNNNEINVLAQSSRLRRNCQRALNTLGYCDNSYTLDDHNKLLLKKGGEQEPIKSKDITSADVICERGKFAYNHIGNIRYRDQVSAATNTYWKSQRKCEKSLVALRVLGFVWNAGGRFLKKAGGDHWVELDEAQAKEKVHHAIRYERFHVKTTDIKTAVVTDDSNHQDEQISKYINGSPEGEVATKGTPIIKPTRHRIGQKTWDPADAFPCRLYRMLQDAERDNFTDTISWESRGLAFKIHDGEALCTSILRRYFRQTHLGSFKKQLSNYGFRRVRTGPYKGAYFHEMFQQSRPNLCKQILLRCNSVVKPKNMQDIGIEESWTFSNSATNFFRGNNLSPSTRLPVPQQKNSNTSGLTPWSTLNNLQKYGTTNTILSPAAATTPTTAIDSRGDKSSPSKGLPAPQQKQPKTPVLTPKSSPNNLEKFGAKNTILQNHRVSVLKALDQTSTTTLQPPLKFSNRCSPSSTSAVAQLPRKPPSTVVSRTTAMDRSSEIKQSSLSSKIGGSRPGEGSALELAKMLVQDPAQSVWL